MSFTRRLTRRFTLGTLFGGGAASGQAAEPVLAVGGTAGPPTGHLE